MSYNQALMYKLLHFVAQYLEIYHNEVDLIVFENNLDFVCLVA